MLQVDRILKELQTNKVVKRSTLNNMMKGGRNITSLIQVLERKGYIIETTYNELSRPIAYTYIEYIKPFYIVARDIQHNYPEFEKRIRDEYNELINNKK